MCLTCLHGLVDDSGPQDPQSLAAIVMDRRRSAIAAVVSVAPLGGQQGPQGPKRKDTSPFCWADHVARLSPAEFKLRYRLSHEAFYALVDLLEPELNDVDVKYQGSKEVPIEIVVKLAVALRYLAGGQTVDLQLIYHISRIMCYTCV